MKSYKKALVASCVTIALSASLIAGSTFALFTSDSTTNIAVTSGKVDVVASIGNVKTYSYNQDGSKQELKSDAPNENGEYEFIYGTATYDAKENYFAINNVVPGDKITFDVKITNKSTVNVKYSVNVAPVVTSEENGAPYSEELFNALTKTYTGYDSVAGWTEWKVTDEVKEKTISVSIELPYDYDDFSNEEDSIQGKSCGLAFTVEAVQGNGHINNPERAIRTAVIAGVGKANDGLDKIGAYGSRFSALEYVAENDAWESTLTIDCAIVPDDIENSEEIADDFKYLQTIIYKVIEVINYAVDEEVANIKSIQIDEQGPLREFNGEKIDNENWLVDDLMAVATAPDGFLGDAGMSILWTTGVRVPVYITGMDGVKVTYALTILAINVPEEGFFGFQF